MIYETNLCLLQLCFWNCNGYPWNVGFGLEEFTTDLDITLLFETWEHDTQRIQGLGNYTQRPLTLMFQHSWDSGRITQAWKVGLIKLVPKVASPESFHQWRPISLMGGCIRCLQRSWQIDYKSKIAKVYTSHPIWFY